MNYRTSAEENGTTDQAPTAKPNAPIGLWWLVVLLVVALGVGIAILVRVARLRHECDARVCNHGTKWYVNGQCLCAETAVDPRAP